MQKIKAYGICLYKKEQKDIKILLCKSVSSLERWGCLKGVQETDETKEQTATREFFEESNIKIGAKSLEQYFEQTNEYKDIGIYLVNSYKVANLDKFFIKDTLYKNYLSWENIKVKFFSLNNLPLIKKKQTNIILKIKEFLQKTNNYKD